MSTEYSSDDLLDFLREAALAGRMTPSAARSRRAAAQALFEKLLETEAADLRELDVGVLKSRFLDIRGDGLRSEVVELYAARLVEALDDFFRFRQSPNSFMATTNRHQNSLRRDGPSSRSSEDQALETVRLGTVRQRSDVIPVPLAAGRVVYLHGVPADLSSREAHKIARVVSALVDDREDDD